VEVSCEKNLSTCDTDMFSFKAYLTRWMAATTQMAPFTKELIALALATSAKAAALQCSGGDNGRMCGLSWIKGASWDGTQGAGQQMAALEVVMSNLINFGKIPPLVTSTTGGTSGGNPSAGGGQKPAAALADLAPPTEGDIVGAGFVTAVALLAMMALFVWICVPYWEPWTTATESGSQEVLVSSGDLSGSGSEDSGKANEKTRPDSDRSQDSIERYLWFEVSEIGKQKRFGV
jgi:Glycosyl hydrolase family 76